jgi:hypothetical protein
MLISRGVGLTEGTLLVLAIFSDLLLYVSLLASSLLLHNPPQRSSMYLLLAAAPRYFG